MKRTAIVMITLQELLQIIFEKYTKISGIVSLFIGEWEYSNICVLRY